MARFSTSRKRPRARRREGYRTSAEIAVSAAASGNGTDLRQASRGKNACFTEVASPFVILMPNARNQTAESPRHDGAVNPPAHHAT